MHKTFSILLLAVLFFSCGPFQPGNSNVVVKGRLVNSIDSFVLLKENYLEFKSHKAYIDKEGNFEFLVSNENAQYYTLQVDNQALDIFLYPDDKLRVDGDASDFRNSVKYIGSSSYINNYLQKRDKHWSQLSVDIDSVFSLAVSDFTNFSENHFNQKISWINENLANDRERIQSFRSLELQGQYYDKAIWQMLYPDLHSELTSNFVDGDQNFLGIELDENLECEELLVSGKYITFLHLFIESKIDSLVSQSDTGDTEQLRTRFWFQVVKESFKNYRIQNRMYFDGMMNLLGNAPFQSSGLFSEFLLLCQDENQIKIASAEFEAYKKLNSGMPAPLFEFQDEFGKRYNLSDFKGQNLYIDVWASWCTPCLNEYKILKSSRLMESDSIKVLSISVDDNPKKWKEMRQRQGMKGDQFIAPGGWNSDLIKEYRIKTVPNFITVDKQGRVINVRAPKPSEIEKGGEILNFY